MLGEQAGPLDERGLMRSSGGGSAWSVTRRPLTDPRDCRLPISTVLASMAVMWAAYFVLTSLRGSIVGLGLDGDLLWRRAAVCLIGFGVTCALWSALRWFEHRSLWTKIAAALVFALPAALAIAKANTIVFADLQERIERQASEEQGFTVRRDEGGNLLVDIPYSRFETVDGERPRPRGREDGLTLTLVSDPKDSWRAMVDIALARYFLLLAWTGVYFALLAGARARAAERRAGEFREAARTAQLRSLRYQVNPHFLFNAFNSLSAMVMTGKADRAERMIENLSSFYRRSLAEDPTSEVSLSEEFALQRDYLDIEAVRFPDRLRMAVDLPEELARARVPGMILQPLVENSVKYGVSASRAPVTITLSARRREREAGGTGDGENGGDELILRVTDDGPAMAGSKTGCVRTGGGGAGLGIGLANVRDRLDAWFGDAASLTAGPSDKGYETELRMPLLMP